MMREPFLPTLWAGASISKLYIMTTWDNNSTPIICKHWSPLTGNYTDRHVYVTPSTRSSGLIFFFCLRDDLVQLIVDKDSQSFLVQTVSPGLTVLRVQGDPINPFLSDYTTLFVVPAISEPPGFLRSGDIICFSSPITDQQGKSVGY